jgi:DNA-binding CsgD family transcriptional regulator
LRRSAKGLLDVLPRVVPSLYTSYNEITADGRPLVTIVSPELDQRWLELWGQFGHQNPLVQRHLSTRDPRAYRMSDVIDGPSFRRLDLYREVFAPLGVHHQMAVTLPAPPTLLIGLAVVAPDDYTDAQRRMLDLARPHLIQAVNADHTVMPVHDDAPLIVRRIPNGRGTTVLLFERSERPTPLDQIEALGLSTREAEVLRRFMRGETTAEAAISLSISPRTIHKHAERIYRKLGVTDRAAAVSTAWASLDAGR